MDGFKSKIYLTFYSIYVTLKEKSRTSRKEGYPLPKNIALKVARAEKDMTQKALAEAAGISRQTMNAIEKGEYNPTIRLCRRICRILDKSLDDLFWEDDEDEENEK